MNYTLSVSVAMKHIVFNSPVWPYGWILPKREHNSRAL